MDRRTQARHARVAGRAENSRRRLRPVVRWLDDAAERAEESPEFVHQLRVSTRRAMAALEGYAELLPQAKAAKMTKQLGRIRKRAGAARDCDVFLERLGKGDDAERRRPLLKHVEQLRTEAQEPVVKLHAKLKRKKFAKKIEKLIDSVRAPKHEQETTLVQWARHGLARNVAKFFEAGAADLGDNDLLHQFRIEGKHLRYALEYFSAAFGPELRNELYAEIERVQALLGIVNDHASAIEHLTLWRAQLDEPEVQSLIDEQTAVEQTALCEAKQEFYRWWTPQRSADLRNRFAVILELPDEEHAA
ncbi:MAG: CHAD domain-containing protein [Pirellulales bacterium]